MPQNLKPVRNVRKVTPRCCATCRYLRYEVVGWSSCQRPDGPTFDTGDRNDILTVCDLWRSGVADASE